MRGPSAAKTLGTSTRSTRQGNAERHDIKHVTAAAIAYSAMLVSSEPQIEQQIDPLMILIDSVCP